MSWTSLAYTETGLVRTLNEDSVLSLDNEQLWVVADGMGGHNSGDFASQLVVEHFRSFTHPSKQGHALRRIDELLQTCNSELRQKAANDEVPVIGCTVAVLLIHKQKVMCSWSGDSRIYRIRDNTIKQLTRDHNYQSFLLDAAQTGLNAEVNTNEIPNGEALTAAIGGESSAFIEHCVYTLKEDDQFIVCTDGLYKELKDSELLEIPVQLNDITSIIDELLRRYRDRGARDNVGVIYVTKAENNAGAT